MPRGLLHTLAAFGLSAATGAAGAGISVQFDDARRFTDAGSNAGYQTPAENRSLAEIRRFLLERGARCVEADQTLDILVLDVDFAGQDEWWHRRDGGDFRVLRGVAAPKMELEYAWRASDGRVFAQGVDRLSGLAYLGRGTEMQARSEPLYYEKLMLADWLQRRFCGAQKAGSN